MLLGYDFTSPLLEISFPCCSPAIYCFGSSVCNSIGLNYYCPTLLLLAITATKAALLRPVNEGTDGYWRC